MKKLLMSLFIGVILTVNLLSAVFSPTLKWASQEITRNREIPISISDNYSVFYHPDSNEITYGVIIKLDNVVDLHKLKINEVELHTILPSGIVTAWVSDDALDELQHIEEIIYVDLSAKSHARLDVSRIEIGAADVHIGTGLGQAYTGTDVIVGVIDTGIDIDHADFKNDDGTTRILYIWDQTVNGNPPQGYSYGTEWTAAEINDGQCTQIDDNNHGTHVAGTAAGNGNADNPFGDYTGIAPESNIIFVKGMQNVIDGTNYIFTQAQALGKPAVINMSFGEHDGPHDGTSLYEQGITGLTGNGKIIVAAAGNEADKIMHLSYTVDYDGGASLFFPNPEQEIIGFDIWYSSEYQMDVAVDQIDDNLDIIESSDWILFGNQYDDTFASGQTVQIDATEISNPNNGDRHIEIMIQGAGLDTYYWGLYFSSHTSGETAIFDCWSVVDGSGDFIEAQGYIAGDNLKTVGAPATANNVIAVGAYNTKNVWIDVNGQTHTESFTVGERANFSSIGPTRDGRIVPQICAPGNLIAAALTEDIPPGDSRVIQGGYYHVLEGTSMATPHITGVVALMMQADPTMGFDEIMATLILTARQDEYTASNGDLPNSYWGAGKINAYGSVLLTNVDDDLMELPNAFLHQNYPNPFNPETEISFSIQTAQHVELKIFNIKGQRVKTLLNSSFAQGDHSVKWFGDNESGEPVSSGIYFYRLRTDNNCSTKKCLLLK
ncbi:MAG: S8 family serine peptidase [Candidatus Cloacimonetes bacterium]|nr:S8 family serine peptidase [Candidatus Cloacimonadota bacterium]